MELYIRTNSSNQNEALIVLTTPSFKEEEEEEELISLNKIRYTITLSKKNIFYHIINESTVYPGLISEDTQRVSFKPTRSVPHRLHKRKAHQ